MYGHGRNSVESFNAYLKDGGTHALEDGSRHRPRGSVKQYFLATLAVVAANLDNSPRPCHARCTAVAWTPHMSSAANSSETVMSNADASPAIVAIVGFAGLVLPAFPDPRPASNSWIWFLVRPAAYASCSCVKWFAVLSDFSALPNRTASSEPHTIPILNDKAPSNTPYKPGLTCRTPWSGPILL